MECAKFSFDNHIFTDFEIHTQNATDELTLQLHPNGVFDADNRVFSLQIDFRIISEKNEPENLFVAVRCMAKFTFEEAVTDLNEIPNYFYANSIAIVYPYLRAFISTLTIQSNTRPIVLPTMNLTTLGKDLEQNTRIL